MKNPSLGKLVKDLSVYNCELTVNGFVELFHKILPLVVSPNLEVLSGELNSDDFYDVIVEIAQASSTKFTKLRIIPYAAKLECLGYRKAAAYFKESLQELVIPGRIDKGFPKEFSTSTCLTTFKFSHGDMNVKRLKQILNTLPYIQDLEFDYIIDLDDEMNKDEIERWFDANTTKQKRPIEKVSIVGVYTPVPFEYLALRYTEIGNIYRDMQRSDAYDDDGIPPFVLRNMTDLYMRAVEVLKKFPTYHFLFEKNKYIRHRNVGATVRLYHDNVTVEYLGYDEELIYIHANKAENKTLYT